MASIEGKSEKKGWSGITRICGVGRQTKRVAFCDFYALLHFLYYLLTYSCHFLRLFVSQAFWFISCLSFLLSSLTLGFPSLYAIFVLRPFFTLLFGSSYGCSGELSRPFPAFLGSFVLGLR